MNAAPEEDCKRTKNAGFLTGALSLALALVLAIGLWHPAVPAETIYRCPPGNVYQQESCDKGMELVIDPKMNMIGTAPTPSSLYLSETLSSNADGPWVATIPMPPRMASTPSRHTTFLPRGHVLRISQVRYGPGHTHHYRRQGRK
jgi:hypothetical protein